MISHLCPQAPSQDLYMLASSQNQRCVLPMLAPSQDQPWLFVQWLTKFGLFHESQQYILAAVIPSAASIRCIHHDCNMVRAWSKMHLLLFVSSDSYVQFVRFVRAIRLMRFIRFVRAIYCNTYIHIHFIQPFCPLPALLNADACLFG
jgi:hypothetical protein